MSVPDLRTRPPDQRCLVDVVLPATSGSVPVLRHLVTALAVAAGAGKETTAVIALCTTEAVTNAVLHAYPEATEEPQVRVTADASEGTFEVVVTDHGQGMLARPSNAGGLGQGLKIIARCAARFGVDELPEGGTAVWMRFVL